MRAECTPSSFHGSVAGVRPQRVAHHHRRAAGAAVGARIGQKEALALEAHAERRGDHRLAHHRQVVQRVVKAERKADDQQRRADLDLSSSGCRWCGVNARSSADSGSAAVELDHRHVDLAAASLP